MNPPIQGFGTRFMGTGLFKIFLGKLLLPYAFDSLWKVSDLSTQVYMNYFYVTYFNEGQIGFAEASREAKLKLLNSEEFNNPYYWSAFILIGN